MNKLEQLLEETNFTKEEFETYRKVQRNYQLSDLEELLNEMLEDGEITQADYNEAIEKADIIVYKYDKWLDYDWRETMKSAIDWILKGV